MPGQGSSSSTSSRNTSRQRAMARAACRRARAMPEAWQKGVGANPPVVVCGERLHYSVTRAVAELGLGMRCALAMESREWQMNSPALRETLDGLAASGTPVMAVVASAASAILSEEHRHRLRGIEHARFVAWVAHKMMLMPLAAGMQLVREENDLTQAFTQHAPYLFHGATGEPAWDRGTRSFQCSLRADAQADFETCSAGAACCE